MDWWQYALIVIYLMVGVAAVHAGLKAGFEEGKPFKWHIPFLFIVFAVLWLPIIIYKAMYDAFRKRV